MEVPDAVFEALVTGAWVSGCTPLRWHEETQELEVRIGAGLSKRKFHAPAWMPNLFVPLSVVEAFAAGDPESCPVGMISTGALGSTEAGSVFASDPWDIVWAGTGIFGWAVDGCKVTGRFAWDLDCSLELAAVVLERLVDLKSDETKLAPLREFISTVRAYLIGAVDAVELEEAGAAVVEAKRHCRSSFARSALLVAEYVAAPPMRMHLMLARASLRHSAHFAALGLATKPEARRSEEAAQCADFMRIARRHAAEMIARSQS